MSGTAWDVDPGAPPGRSLTVIVAILSHRGPRSRFVMSHEMPRRVGPEVASRLATALRLAWLLVGGALPIGSSVFIECTDPAHLGTVGEQ